MNEYYIPVMSTKLADLHCYTDKGEEVELEQTYHDLVVLVHCYNVSLKASARYYRRVNVLFMTGFAPTTWKIAQLEDVSPVSELHNELETHPNS